MRLIQVGRGNLLFHCRSTGSHTSAKIRPKNEGTGNCHEKVIVHDERMGKRKPKVDDGTNFRTSANNLSVVYCDANLRVDCNNFLVIKVFLAV